MKLLFVILLLVAEASGQLRLGPPTDTTKVRHGGSVTVAWDFTENEASAGLLYFSVKVAYDLNQTPVEYKQVPKQARSTQFVVLFTTQYPKYVYYVISAVYDGTKGESFPSEPIMAERIGPPPSE